eukprot:g2430.t1
MVDYRNQSPLDFASPPLQDLLKQKSSETSKREYKYNVYGSRSMSDEQALRTRGYTEQLAFAHSKTMNVRPNAIQRSVMRPKVLRRSGWLYKLGKEERLWKQRFFRLEFIDETSAALSWYESPKTEKPKRRIMLNGKCRVHEVPTSETGYKFSFRLVLPDFERDLTLYASTSSQRTSWVVSLRTATTDDSNTVDRDENVELDRGDKKTVVIREKRPSMTAAEESRLKEASQHLTLDNKVLDAARRSSIRRNSSKSITDFPRATRRSSGQRNSSKSIIDFPRAQYRMRYSFHPSDMSDSGDDDNERFLRVEKGEIVSSRQSALVNDWFEGTNESGESGLIPSTYAEPLSRGQNL